MYPRITKELLTKTKRPTSVNLSTKDPEIRGEDTSNEVWFTRGEINDTLCCVLVTGGPK